MNNDIKQIRNALETCSASGVPIDLDHALESLQVYISLIKEWNTYSTLVSIGDAENRLSDHCVDSLSLAPYLNSFISENDASYLDIGTGGGFPALPLCILFPELDTLLLERNRKKTVFLKKATAKLGLANIEIGTESFDEPIETEFPKFITARAIEKTAQVIPHILSSMSQGEVFLCQSEVIHELSSEATEGFSVTELTDSFSESGMRRNRLYKVTRCD